MVDHILRKKAMLEELHLGGEVLYEIITEADQVGYGIAVADIFESERHWHKFTTETYHVLHGTGRVEMVDESEKVVKEIRQGDTLVIKPGIVHHAYNMKPYNKGDEFIVLVHSMPAWSQEDHYRIDNKIQEADIVIANTYAKVTESATALKMASSLTSKGGDLVIIANTPEGQVIHYLAGPWGRNIWGSQPLNITIPPNVNNLILFTEYPDINGMQWYKPEEKVCTINKWDDIILMLQKLHGDDARVAVYPNADILYTS